MDDAINRSTYNADQSLVYSNIVANSGCLIVAMTWISEYGPFSDLRGQYEHWPSNISK